MAKIPMYEKRRAMALKLYHFLTKNTSIPLDERLDLDKIQQAECDSSECRFGFKYDDHWYNFYVR